MDLAAHSTRAVESCVVWLILLGLVVVFWVLFLALEESQEATKVPLVLFKTLPSLFLYIYICYLSVVACFLPPIQE